MRGELFEQLILELLSTAAARWPKCLLHFEDFGNSTAFHLLQNHRKSFCVFNDDIQGTAAVAVAGMISAVRARGVSLRDDTFVFVGAGEAGCGIAELLVQLLVEEGLTETDARGRVRLFDSKGVLCSERQNLVAHKALFCGHSRGSISEGPFCAKHIHEIKPSVLIGVCAQV